MKWIKDRYGPPYNYLVVPLTLGFVLWLLFLSSARSAGLGITLPTLLLIGCIATRIRSPRTDVKESARLIRDPGRDSTPIRE